MGSGPQPWRALASAAAVVAAALALGASASSASTQGGTLVVRLVTDPAPPGVSWTYTGAGPSFELDQSPSEHSLPLPAGSYRLSETPAASGQASMLTALACADPDHDTTTSLRTGTATVGLEDGETVTCTFTHRALGRRSGGGALALARTYAPVLRLSDGEPYRPIRIEDFLAASTLHGGSPPQGLLLQQQPTLFTLPTSPIHSYLDVDGAQPNSNPSAYPRLEREIEASRPRPAVYWHVVRDRATGRTAVEYWLLYLYNDFYDRHEADWEGVTIVLEDGHPLGLSFTAHQGRRWTPWSAATTSGVHPIDDVARGSHAGYPHPGRYSIRVCWTLVGRHCTPTPKVDTATGTGASLDPASYDLLELGGTPYSGSWTSGTYILGIGLTKDQISDPRERSDYSDPFSSLGS